MKHHICLFFKINIIFCFILLLFPQKSYAWIDQFDSSASVVIGQQNFTSNLANQGGSADTNTLSFPRIASVGDNKIFIADRNNNRVLIFNSIPSTNNAFADVVIGQTNFTNVLPNQGIPADANTLNFAGRRPDVTYAERKLFIADSLNQRVLIYNSTPQANNASANVVVGQPDFTTTSGGTTQSKINSTYGVFSDGTRLFVADTLNARVLIWNSIPVSNGVAADLVLGQSDFITAASGCSQSKMNNPMGIFYDGTKLYVSDWGNSRILIWNSLPTSNGQVADVVVGQQNFSSCSANQAGSVAANTISQPQHAVWSDGVKLVIADYGNHRVLIYRQIPASNNASADAVIGQKNFTDSGANQGGSPNANTLYNPDGVRIYDNKMFIAEVLNHRVTIFDLGPASTSILINTGAGTTLSSRVTLTLSAEGAQEMMISNNASFSGAGWEPYTTTKEWDLSSGNGVKIVYAKFRDYAQFESVAISASIDLPSTLAGASPSATVIPKLPETGASPAGESIPPIFIIAGIFVATSFLFYLIRRKYKT